MSITFPNESAEYRVARDLLMQDEIALRRAMEAVAVSRRALPPGGLVPEDYVFDGLNADGVPAKLRLSELFAPGKDSLVIYNFMFPRMPQDDRPGPSEGVTAQLKREDGPCPSCTTFLDQLDGAAKHLNQKINFVVIAKAPLERLIAFAEDRSWKNLCLLSVAGNNFKRHYHAESPEGDQLPMMTVFHRSGDEIRHFWSSEMMYGPADPGQDPRHLATLDTIWNIFDFTPGGRPSNWNEQLSYDCCHASAS
ncbi:DUF899 family protein [Acidobacterium sp. S8]|uniref:DUF899 family protein n=1 Tax=Acidobacterium sp. S8 TaxID=1641854 RepID=UPI00131CE067|nr:DUF899 family protein [Acidobacterium sp. S8]